MPKKNSTDLHVQYKLETGESFQWDPPKSTYDYSGSGYHSTSGYDRNYAYWLEEKLLKLLLVEQDNKTFVEYIQSLEEKIERLEEQDFI